MKPPRLVGSGASPELVGWIGAPVTCLFGANNVGGEGRGIDVVVWGEALDREVLRLEKIELLTADGRLTAPLEKREVADGGRAWVAAFPGFALRSSSAEAEDLQQTVKAALLPSVMAELSFGAVAAGAPELRVSFVSHDAREAEHVAIFCARILPATRRPLRVAPGRSDLDLVALDQRSTLFGLGVSSLPVAEVAPIAAELFERWGELLPEHGEYRLTIFPASHDSDCRIRRATPQQLFSRPRWPRLAREMVTEQAVVAERRVVVGAPDAFSAPTDGFSFCRKLQRDDDDRDSEALDRRCPTIGFWLSTEGRDDDDLAEARELLGELLDELMKRASGVQAVMGRWGWTELYTGTPYEWVCGLGPGQWQSWVERYLRGVTDDWIWLGRALGSRIDRDALEKVANVMKVGEAVRLRVRKGRSLDDLERGLAPILASQADWERQRRSSRP